MTLSLEIATTLGISQSRVIAVAAKADHAYKKYTIAKKTGGQRTIYHPSKELKALQRWLLRRYIEHWRMHDAAMAYRSGIGIKHNIAAHQNNSFILHLDLKEFFPSITSNDILRYLTAKPTKVGHWDVGDNTFFSRVVCREGRLTIGAPSSPALANALCFELDKRIAAQAKEYNVTYTRYADDLYLSTSEKNVLKELPGYVKSILKNLPLPKHLSLNHSKTRFLSRAGRRIVTGLILTQDGAISVGRSVKRGIRSELYTYEKLDSAGRVALAGKLAYIRSVEPDFINRLITKFGAEHVNRARKNA